MKVLKIILPVIMMLGCASASRESAGAAFPVGAQNQNNAEEEISRRGRIIIFNASLEIEVSDPEKLGREIAGVASKFKGYVVTSGNTRAVIRVPSGSFSDALTALTSYGTVLSKQIYSKDVTEAFRDTEIRLDNKLKARNRYLELLKKAENVTAALRVEKELERLNSEIESLKGKIKRLSHLSAFSTITVNIEKEIRPGPVGYLFWGAYRVVKWLFIRD